jgi:uncharacterized tellurite resistance protein B-like protein
MMTFDQDEKLAVVKAIAETIELDKKYKVGELMYLDELMETLDFDMQFVEEARALSSIKAVSILRSMSDEKKKALIIIIDKMTEADGVVHKKETDFVVNLVSILQ